MFVGNLDHDDILVGAALRACLAPDARVRVDRDDAGIGVAMDGTSRAADHAYGIDAVHTGMREHQWSILWPISNKTRCTSMCGSARLDAFIAACATI